MQFTILTDDGYKQVDQVVVVQAYMKQQDMTHYRASRWLNTYNKGTRLKRIEDIGFLVPERLIEDLEISA